MECSKD